uniref:Small ribosomal subunit protein bS16c n=1 Tax=Plagiogramma staurophorum TaxID=1003089 RepID=A0A2U9NML1_9STRA|nr:ribosomal protein S16 [Plagiogramma staurophorum]AWT38315.1 ribosomal protein S16 [Plagiogramma staurophorum]
MLKLRLKRTGRKRSPAYRLVIMENITRRDGRPIDEVGYYNPITKKSNFNEVKIKKWLAHGVKPTQTAFNLLKKAYIIESKIL